MRRTTQKVAGKHICSLHHAMEENLTALDIASEAVNSVAPFELSS